MINSSSAIDGPKSWIATFQLRHHSLPTDGRPDTSLLLAESLKTFVDETGQEGVLLRKNL